jgi:hypothetical protein
MEENVIPSQKRLTGDGGLETDHGGGPDEMNRRGAVIAELSLVQLREGCTTNRRRGDESSMPPTLHRVTVLAAGWR